MIRLWFKDMTFMDVPLEELHYWEMDPELDRITIIDKQGNPLN